ncbi:hypothetical protein BDZ91DRAFT_793734 [Kalaharituber pfeilii]|nr:hypothetical protein BDZ91DRAFT_793734 [Kalaharituber pfeilii]
MTDQRVTVSVCGPRFTAINVTHPPSSEEHTCHITFTAINQQQTPPRELAIEGSVQADQEMEDEEDGRREGISTKRELTLRDAFNLTQHVAVFNMPRMVPKTFNEILPEVSVVKKPEEAGPAQYHVKEITEWWSKLILELINEAIKRNGGTPMDPEKFEYL